VLAAIIDRVGTDWLPDERDRRRAAGAYDVLVRAIVGQQFSTLAAAAMYRKLAARFGGRLPTPAQILAEDPEELRLAVGLSHAKVGYLRSLAEHLTDGSLDLDSLQTLPDEEVVARLTAVKGLGAWSAGLFLIFYLGRPDVLAAGDLGIRRAIMREYGLERLPTPAEVVQRGERWRPDRTLACLLLWRSVAATPA
jgi:DNA-3-methyladenine glycosylase II